jgi:HAD superfamily hydrolase (TIGR01549 family)
MTNAGRADIKAVFLDAGNTLVFIDYPFIRNAISAHGVATTVDTLITGEWAARKVFDEPGIATVADMKGKWILYFKTIFNHAGVRDESVIQKLFGEMWIRHRECNLWSYAPEESYEALRKLRAAGYVIGIISNSDGKLKSLLEKLDMAKMVDFALDSNVVGIEKPDPRIFRLALERAGFSPDESVHAGDFHNADVVGARAAGIRPVLIDPADNHKDKDCLRIRSVGELPGLLANL